MTTSESNDENGPNPFAALGLSPELVAALGALGYEEPTPIQREAIPPLLAGRDVLGAGGDRHRARRPRSRCRSCSGSASARRERRGRTAALILVPTRELAMQVAEAVHRYGKGIGVRVAAGLRRRVDGARSSASLKRGVDVVVATPGRALDHIRRKTLKLDAVRIVVLDEADEMLDMGFAEDLEAILARDPAETGRRRSSPRRCRRASPRSPRST